MNEKEVARAAVIVELEDGSRMLYAYNPEQPITVETRIPAWFTSIELGMFERVSSIPYELVVTGEGMGGVAWAGDMPTAQPEASPELGAASLAIEEGETDDR